MISICNHCGAKYQLPDKMLGKQARCKTCKRLFVIVPAETEVELPEPTGSTVQMAPVQEEENELDALASAASGSDFAPAPRSRPHHEEAYEDGRRAPRKMAKGAQVSMAMGITACAFAAAGLVLMIIGMVNGNNQALLVTLGVITLGLLAIGAVLSMLAIVNGTSAKSKIRRARHPLAGRSEASAGSLTGTIALGVVFACTITIGIFLAKRGGIKFEKEVIQPASLSLPADPAA